jgi:hypothetical protein
LPGSALSDIDLLITDSGLNDKSVSEMEAVGVRVARA